MTYGGSLAGFGLRAHMGVDNNCVETGLALEVIVLAAVRCLELAFLLWSLSSRILVAVLVAAGLN